MRDVNWYAALGFITFVYGLIVWIRERDFRRLVSSQEQVFKVATDAQQALLRMRDEEYKSLLDRVYASKNFPPSEVNLTALYEQNREKEQERRTIRKNGGALPLARVGIGPVDNAQALMSNDVSGRLQQEIEKKRRETAGAESE